MTDTALLAIIAAQVTAIVILRYFATSGGFAWLTARRGITAGPRDEVRRRKQVAAEIRWSLTAAIIYGIPAGLMLGAWHLFGLTRITTAITPAAVLWWLPNIALYLFVHDTWFYWTHRAMHAPALFKRVHAVHHASKPPTAWAAMSFHPWESLSGALLIPALAFLIPIHVSALAVVLTIATVMGVTNHMGWEMFPQRWVNGWFGRHVITASHHENHHQRYTCNYGLYFRFWDQFCGTDKGLARFPSP
ncbi:sterol desaturase family protein [Sandarakinorhabdus glacialis]|uniref:sterol desaturase family protein n=1 Tax=Sandarakinorhabdus glacialis TaxID=1614636 RepID=UPI00166404A2|nr:sterol desaturase family protein [Polymorphobacter glacialis]